MSAKDLCTHLFCRNNDKVITFEKYKTFLYKLAQRANKDTPQDEITKIVDKLQLKLEPSHAGTTVRSASPCGLNFSLFHCVFYLPDFPSRSIFFCKQISTGSSESVLVRSVPLSLMYRAQ